MVQRKEQGADPEEEATRPGRPIEPQRIWAIIKRGKSLLVGAGVLGILLGGLGAKFVVRSTYEANTTLHFEGVEPLDPSTSPDIRRDMIPLVELLKREPVAEELKQRLGLGKVPTIAIQKRFEYAVDDQAGTLAITARADSPLGAANFANTLVDVFLEEVQKHRRQAILETMKSLDERIQAAQEELARAQQSYDAFRHSHGVSADLTEDQSAAMASATDLQARATLAAAEVSGLEARIARLREQLGRSGASRNVGPSTSEDYNKVLKIESSLAEARRQLENVRGRLSPEHPRYQALQFQVTNLENQLRSMGISGVGGGGLRSVAEALRAAEAELEAKRREQAELQALAQQARQKVASFSSIQGEAAVMEAELKVKTQLINELRNRKARLENLLAQVDTGFRVVARAIPPEGALPSKRKYMVAFGTPVALIFLVILWLIAQEVRDLKLYSPAEIAFWANAPVIGASIWPRDPRALTELVADLDDFIPEAKGSMLIVGATPNDQLLAVQLARAIQAEWKLSPAPSYQPAYQPVPQVPPHPLIGTFRPEPADFENTPTVIKSEGLPHTAHVRDEFGNTPTLIKHDPPSPTGMAIVPASRFGPS
ncbi:MAG: hypothetical protein NZM37_11280, partial [Sandaracinaceae bacterium]|nr:hypothetical protein [Sandaracinaceae bacterium]